MLKRLFKRRVQKKIVNKNKAILLAEQAEREKQDRWLKTLDIHVGGRK